MCGGQRWAVECSMGHEGVGFVFVVSKRRRHTEARFVTGVQTWALSLSPPPPPPPPPPLKVRVCAGPLGC